MIIDRIDHASCYYGCHPKIKAVLEYIAGHKEELKEAPVGPQVLPESLDGVKMKIVEFMTVEGTRKWESHTEHAFIYYMLEGRERTGYADISMMGGAVKTEGKDQIVYHEGDGDRILVPEDHFIVIFPQDAHMSKLADGASAYARKCSFKLSEW